MIVSMDPIIMRGISLIPQQETYTPSVTPRCLPVSLSPCSLDCPPGSTISNKFNTMRRSLIYLSKLLSSLQLYWPNPITWFRFEGLMNLTKATSIPVAAII